MNTRDHREAKDTFFRTMTKEFCLPFDDRPDPFDSLPDTFMVEDAVEAIGFGKFQWKLSILTGLAWASRPTDWLVGSKAGSRPGPRSGRSPTLRFLQPLSLDKQNRPSAPGWR